MSEEQELQRIYWFLDDYKTVAHLLQEMAYRLVEIRERWGFSVEEFCIVSGISRETIRRFEGLGINSIGSRHREQSESAALAALPGLHERVEHYKAVARLVEELAHQLIAMANGLGLHAEIACRASNVSKFLIKKLEFISRERLLELKRTRAPIPGSQDQQGDTNKSRPTSPVTTDEAPANTIPPSLEERSEAQRTQINKAMAIIEACRLGGDSMLASQSGGDEPDFGDALAAVHDLLGDVVDALETIGEPPVSTAATTD